LVSISDSEISEISELGMSSGRKSEK